MVSTVIIILSILALLIIVTIIISIIRKMKGKIEIKINNYNYSPGETITGEVILNLKKQVEGKEVNIGLIGEKNYTKTASTTGNTNANPGKQKVFEFKMPLDNTHTYVGEKSYDFNIKIPQNLTPDSTGNKTADILIKSSQILSGNTSSIKWYLIAEFNCKGVDLYKKLQINIA